MFFLDLVNLWQTAEDSGRDHHPSGGQDH